MINHAGSITILTLSSLFLTSCERSPGGEARLYELATSLESVQGKLADLEAAHSELLKNTKIQHGELESKMASTSLRLDGQEAQSIRQSSELQTVPEANERRHSDHQNSLEYIRNALASMRNSQVERDERLAGLGTSLESTAGEVAATKAQHDELAKLIQNLQSEHFNLDISTSAVREIVKTSIYNMQPDDSGYRILWTDHGPLTASILRKYDVGGLCHVELELGNLTAGDLGKGTLKIRGGPTLKTFMNEGRPAAEWFDAREAVEFELSELEFRKRTRLVIPLTRLTALQCEEFDILYVNINGFSFKPHVDQDFQRNAIFDPLSGKYQVIWNDHGAFTVDIAEVAPYADGTRIKMTIGNLTSGKFTNGQFKLEWGARMPDPQAPATTKAAWQKTMQTQTVTFPSLEPGTFNTVVVSLPRTLPSSVGFIRVSELDLTTVILNVPREQR